MAWIGSGFVVWKQCSIPLPDGTGSVVYRARLSKILCAEWKRQVCIQTRDVHGRCRWVPPDPGGAWPVKVYWYPAKSGQGSYLRFEDPISEYFVDLKLGITLLVERRVDGSVYVGEISSPRPQTRYVYRPGTTEGVYTVDGHPVRELETYVASRSGKYIGRIDYPFNRFIPESESPEQPLPKH
jgi:hypothetical protein